MVPTRASSRQLILFATRAGGTQPTNAVTIAAYPRLCVRVIRVRVRVCLCPVSIEFVPTDFKVVTRQNTPADLNAVSVS